MSFCKTFHTLLGYSDLDDRPHFCLPSSPGGLCLIARTFHKPPNVVESSALGKSSGDKTGAAALALSDDVDDDGTTDQGAGDETRAEGFLTCTETLGVESSDERIVDAREEKGMKLEAEEMIGRSGEKAERERYWRSRKSRLRWRDTETARFPPPLPGLDQKGRPRSFLKAERKDGRFVLTEVPIERPEVFSAKREGGRLRLHLQVLNPTQLPTIKEQQEERQVVLQREEQDEEAAAEEEETAAAEEEEETAEEGDEKEERLGGTAGQWRYLQYQSCHHLRLSTSISPLSRIGVA